MSVPSAPQNFSFVIKDNSIIYSWDSVDNAIGYKIYSGDKLLADIKKEDKHEQILTASGNVDNAPKLISDLISTSKFNAPLNIIKVLEDKRELVEKTLFNRLANSYDITSFISEELNFESLNSETNLNLIFDDKTGYIKLSYTEILSKIEINYQTDNIYIENIIQEKHENVYIVAYNDFGESVNSNVLLVKTTPNIPIDFVISKTVGGMLLNWKNNSSINDGYKIFKKDNNNVGWVCIDVIEDKDITSYTDNSSFEINNIYEYKICAYNLIGDSLFTETEFYYVPYEPSWRYINESIEIGFKDTVGADSYKVKYRINNGNYIVKELFSDYSDYTTTLNSLLFNDTVSMSICAVINQKESVYSNEINISGNTYTNLEVINFELFFQNNNDIARIKSDKHIRARGYRVYYKINNSSYNIVELGYSPEKDVYYHDVQMTENFDILTAQFEVYDFFGSAKSEFKEIIYIKEEALIPPENIRRTKTVTGFRLDWKEANLAKLYHIHITINGIKQEIIKIPFNYFEKEIDYQNTSEVIIQIATEIANGNISELSQPIIFYPTINSQKVKSTISNNVKTNFVSNMIFGNKGVITNSKLCTMSCTPNNTKLFKVTTLTYLPVKTSINSTMYLSSSTKNEFISNQIIYSQVKTSFADSYINYEIIQTNAHLKSTIVTKLKIQHPIYTEIHGVRILTIGDSITAGHPQYWSETNTGDERSQYQFWLNKRLNGDFEIINKGYGSDTTDRILARFEKDVLSQNARYCIIQGGTNDLYWAMAENQGSQEYLDQKINTMKSNIMQMIGMSLQNNITPIVGTLIPRTGATGIYRTALFEFNEWIISYCNETEGSYYVDFFNAGKQNIPPTPLEDPNQRGALNPIYDGDALFDEYGNLIKQGRGIHPNIDGYKIMAEAIPLSIFKNSQGSVKLFIDEECQIEETVDESDKLNPKYIVDVSTLRKGRTKRITRYIKNSTFSPIIYGLYYSDSKDMDLRMAVNDGEFTDSANSYLIVNGIHKITIEITIPRDAQSPSVDLHLVNKRLQITSQ